jgi:hypothetical protein
LKAVAGQGFPLEEQPCHDDDHVEFRSPVSHMGVLAERSSRTVEKLLGRSCRPPWRSFPNQCLAAATARGTGGSQRQLLGLAIHRAAVERGVYPPDLAAVTDPELSAELRRWGTVKPNLLVDWRARRTFRAHLCGNGDREGSWRSTSTTRRR